jgi:outer membrane protein OmpA-like peptidoglycan-associated protein
MRQISKNFGLAAALSGGLALVVGCASSPPGELVEARSAYNHASGSTAAQLAPAQLHSAEEALAGAEKQFDIDGDSPRTRDRAYAATRKAQLAEAQARVVMADRTAANADRQVQLTQAQLQVSTTKELNKTREQLASEQQTLATEKQRREEAEKRAAQASADLARIASVKQETRGMVITLSGAVLFASGKSALLPQAQTKLNQVADALTKSQPDSKIVVEGYTDSSGPSSLNDRLSQERADAVRSYLASRGIAADRLTAQGYGPAKPIADNASPEGRANNRRVEIVVQNASTP